MKGRKMVLNSRVLVLVANISADLWQYVACNPERLSTEQVLRLLFVYPFQHLRRLALCLWTFFCFPPPEPYLYYYDSDSESSDSDHAHSDLFNRAHPHIE